ncbi:MAG: hypothetical protein MIO92_14235 [Methanosarcinaceae archaeon]|nr:hypothetical protein [Methanosarcinaceae archaeon]
MIKELYEIERTTVGMTLDEAAKKDNGEIPFRACAMALDQFTGNKRRYPTAVMEKALARITSADGRTMWGSGGHKEKFEVPDVTHRIDKLWISKKAGMLMVEGSILPTTRGKDLAILVKAGKLGLSLKGTGSLKPVEEGKEEVQDDYKLLGIDFVLNPACDIARVSKENLYESVDFEEVSGKDGRRIDEEQEFIAKINEAMTAALTKVDKKIRSLVETELKGRNIEAVELVEDAIKEAETKVRFVLNEAVRSKIVETTLVGTELGMVAASDTEPPVNESVVNQIFKENKIAGTPKTRAEIIASLRKK